MHNILGLIPARGGSKGIPQKNIVLCAGKPLLAYSVEAALSSVYINRVLISTDDAKIAEIAQNHGAEAPFLRPDHLAQDETPALPVIQHAVTRLAAQFDWHAAIIVYLQPTSPLRRAEHIDAAIQILLDHQADTVVSVTEVPHQFHPLSVLQHTPNGLMPFLAGEEAPLRRQDKPVLYARNGPAVLAMTRQTVMEQNTLYGQKTLPYIMQAQDSLDIDTPFDLKLAECLLS
jgi:CMP-N-acetylneuraminic acid synthetase